MDNGRPGGARRSARVLHGLSAMPLPSLAYRKACGAMARACASLIFLGSAGACESSSRPPPGAPSGGPSAAPSSPGNVSAEEGRDPGAGQSDSSAATDFSSDAPCHGGVAFGAVELAFESLGSAELQTALNELAASAVHPLTLVLAAKPPQGFMVASATDVGEDGFSRAFPPGLSPDFAPATVEAGNFASRLTQDRGFVRLGAGDSAVEIELQNVHVEVTTFAKCTSISGVLVATIAGSQSDVVLPTASGPQTLGALADTETEWPVRLKFRGVGVDFDWDSWPTR